MILGPLQRPLSNTFCKLQPVAALVLGFAATLCGLSPAFSFAQDSTPSTQQPAYTLHSYNRIVLTDVTVKDRSGHLVRGLPQSAFQIFDNDQPQTLTSFEEHDAAPTAIRDQPVFTSGVYSNEYLQHLPPVLNIVVLDTTNLGISAQMYLAYEFNRFLKTLPPDLPLAIYARVGESTVLVQDFTSDRQLLLAASAKVMPYLPRLVRDSSPVTLLHQVASELAQIPGHKNVLLFSGGDNANFDPRAHPQPIGASEDTALRKVYDLLEKARITIYPIDARGLIAPGGGRVQDQVSLNVDYQHMSMFDIATGTGGQAFYNRNALTKISNDILATDNSFYTIVFTPKNLTLDNKWHQVKVKVEGQNYQLSYRRGYFADGMNVPTPQDNRPRKQLLNDGKTRDVPADLLSVPITFTASIVPFGSGNPEPGKDFYSLQDYHPPAKQTKTYTIRYSIPPDSFNLQTASGRPATDFDIAVLAFNQAGSTALEKGEHVSITFPKSDPHAPIQVAQDINLPAGDLYLFIAVWDVSNGRTGTLQIPFTAK